jgi:hypothetical protein
MRASQRGAVVDWPMPAPHAAHHAETGHAHGSNTATHDGESTPPQLRACPHCPLASAANVGHGVCVATEGPDHGGFATAKDASERPPLVLTPNWLLPAAGAAPPLIANLSPQAAPAVAAISLNTAYCVLLI